MRCETCCGTGKIGPLPIPCGDCGGSGFSHCCDGSDVDCAVEQIIVSPEAYDEIVAMLNAPANPTQALIDALNRLAPWQKADPHGTPDAE